MHANPNKHRPQSSASLAVQSSCEQRVAAVSIRDPRLVPRVPLSQQVNAILHQPQPTQSCLPSRASSVPDRHHVPQASNHNATADPPYHHAPDAESHPIVVLEGAPSNPF